jgi:hypothetical protein
VNCHSKIVEAESGDKVFQMFQDCVLLPDLLEVLVLGAILVKLSAQLVAKAPVEEGHKVAEVESVPNCTSHICYHSCPGHNLSTLPITFIGLGGVINLLVNVSSQSYLYRHVPSFCLLLHGGFEEVFYKACNLYSIKIVAD